MVKVYDTKKLAKNINFDHFLRRTFNIIIFAKVFNRIVVSYDVAFGRQPAKIIFKILEKPFRDNIVLTRTLLYDIQIQALEVPVVLNFQGSNSHQNLPAQTMLVQLILSILEETPF